MATLVMMPTSDVMMPPSDDVRYPLARRAPLRATILRATKRHLPTHPTIMSRRPHATAAPRGGTRGRVRAPRRAADARVCPRAPANNRRLLAAASGRDASAREQGLPPRCHVRRHTDAASLPGDTRGARAVRPPVPVRARTANHSAASAAQRAPAPRSTPHADARRRRGQLGRWLLAALPQPRLAPGSRRRGGSATRSVTPLTRSGACVRHHDCHGAFVLMCFFAFALFCGGVGWAISAYRTREQVTESTCAAHYMYIVPVLRFLSGFA